MSRGGVSVHALLAPPLSSGHGNKHNPAMGRRIDFDLEPDLDLEALELEPEPEPEHELLEALEDAAAEVEALRGLGVEFT